MVPSDERVRYVRVGAAGRIEPAATMSDRVTPFPNSQHQRQRGSDGEQSVDHADSSTDLGTLVPHSGQRSGVARRS